MQILKEVSDFYKSHKLKHVKTNLSAEKKKELSELISQISNRNLGAFKIVLTPKKDTKYEAARLKKVDLGKGAYCYITDNQVQSEQTILAIHGAPGNCGDWAGIEKEVGGRYRWINFAIPGFDGEDERRGDYAGDHNSLCDLILRLTLTLGVKRIVLLGHSYGSSVCRKIALNHP